MTKYVKCRIIEPEGFPRPRKKEAPRVRLCGISETGPINIKKHFIGKYQSRKEWFFPPGKSLDLFA
jgi:hypothetical protein